MDSFSFTIPQNIKFGAGTLDLLPDLAKELGKSKGYIISGPHLNKIGMVAKCRKALKNAGMESECFTETEGNPSTDTVVKATEGFKKSKADFIVAFGGGSPLDVAKAMAVLATYGGNIVDYEGAGKVMGPVVPMIAIPTTAGTGSEVTAFSVITDHSRNYKLTVVSNYLLPAYVILDPDLIATVPANTAAACGIDAMVHALEAYISKAASPFSDIFAREALRLIGGSIRDYVADRSNPAACESMMVGSLFAGIAFSHARLGNVHAMSHPVSAYFDVPHGVANAILLPTVVDFNKDAADPEKYRYIYGCISKDMGADINFTPDMLATEIRMLNYELGILPTLSDIGVTSDKFEQMADDAMKSGNIQCNPQFTMKNDILKLYEQAF
ncbi:iron-containing alcohol dehydrogenase [Mediterraneibacter gnavus]|uniref:Iron-containing alcohol dehydrogenase n=1 Tax=Mediterraneibacter gnavus TaxID=33038 RepID=A0A9X3HHA3_MEDGN|nr:iron-containing alcohol dehydrogenase [Mediterraneibacter gnavus]MCZ7695026.1 iron-containing alcohol dehydrogenase [Mediterraneibacter gnavus]MCZ7736586.1 iron-containing alcohol dehydrogenase [Mediterraneibacter gnavus]MDC6148217.1 iron-containing alcohol dehydrogenase [Mediterraneibacter gnavus]MDE1201634.1 iron-containing alcohol dehydrogenase [Mediterraneibacter gnavus]